MATGDVFLDAREPDCTIKVGEFIELIRLPGVEFEVLSILKRDDTQGPATFLLELNNDECGVVYLWHHDESETLWSLTELFPWDQPQSSAIEEGE